MRIFEPITLHWEGRDYSIPPDDVLRCIAKIEDHITLIELSTASNKRTIPLAKMAIAFGAVLRHAGAHVSDDEVYAGMFADGNLVNKAQVAVTTLLTLMIPPGSLTQDAAAGASPPGKAQAAGNGSSKRRSKSR